MLFPIQGRKSATRWHHRYRQGKAMEGYLRGPGETGTNEWLTVTMLVYLNKRWDSLFSCEYHRHASRCETNPAFSRNRCPRLLESLNAHGGEETALGPQYKGDIYQSWEKISESSFKQYWRSESMTTCANSGDDPDLCWESVCRKS